jgi:hypothetical protein
MSISRKSSDVYVVDIPDVRNTTVKFYYSYFTSDEGLTEYSAASEEIKYHETPDFESYLKYIFDRIPRFNVIHFSPTSIPTIDKKFSLDWFRKFTFKPSNSISIAKNFDKIMDEDHFSSSQFTAIQFHDGGLANKIENLVSSSAEQHMYVENYEGDISDFRKAHALNSSTPDWIPFRLISKGLTTTDATLNKIELTSPLRDGKTTLVSDDFFEGLSRVDVHMQINNKVLHDLVDSSVKSPIVPESTELLKLSGLSTKLQKNAIGRSSESQPDTKLKFVNVKKWSSSGQNRSGADVMGYIVDKLEVLPGGEVKFFSPLVVENPNLGVCVDFEVKYGSTYMYAVRTVAKVNLTAVEEESGDILTVECLVSSKPSNKCYVTCTEDCPPASPTDLNFRWDHGFDRHNKEEGTGRLIVSWTSPPNSQRDIKKFQIFRRETVNEPFLLIREYNFNDNQVPLPAREVPGPGVSVKLDSPKMFYFDMDFTKKSRYIYAMCCVDAHELSSCYSDQFFVSFDEYKNKLKKELVSHSGAPKSYPNMYLEGDTFIDSIIDENHDRVRIYFNPEFFEYVDNSGKRKRLFETKQTKGKYAFQFLSTTAQDSETFTVEINDKRGWYTKGLRLTSAGITKDDFGKYITVKSR